MADRLRLREVLCHALEEIATILDGTDQRYWAGVLRALRDRVENEPGQSARDVLALYEGPRAPQGAVEGDWAFDTLSVTRGGNAYTVENPALWQQTLRYARLLSDVYEHALQLWQAYDAARVAMPAPSAVWTKIVDYGGGAQVWQHGKQYVARYDCGAHVSVFRENAISRNEAEQAMLGSRHFTRMILALQHRLQAAGTDPYQGSYDPLPNPV